MRARPIGTRQVAPRDSTRLRRKPLRAEPQQSTGNADIYPVTVRINAGPMKGKSHSFSRLIITADALYLATSPDKGTTVGPVYRFDLPTGERRSTAAKKGSWGPYSWSGCGCVNGWGIHRRDDLIARAPATSTEV